MTSPLDEKGLEAAEAAWRASVEPTCKLMLRTAIRAYLSATALPDGMEVVRKLRYRVENPSAWPEGFDQSASDLMRDAADALSQAQSALAAMRVERDEALGWPKRSDITHYCTDCEMVAVLHEGRCGCGSGRVVSIASMWHRAEAAEQVRDMRGALEELVDSLTPAEHAAGRDPAYGDVVRNLGKQIGFGALMSCASTEWRLWLEENGYPVGSEFVSGPCRSVLQSDLARARLSLKNQESDRG